MRRIALHGLFVIWVMIAPGSLWAVETRYFEHNSEKQFKEGDPNGVLISSRGEMTLAYRSRSILAAGDTVWVVNDLLKSDDGDLYVATSGKGVLYRIGSDGKRKLLYGQGSEDQPHVFALAQDRRGRLLAGTGGEAGLLLRFENGQKPKTLFKEKEILYIWDIAIGPAGRIYMGTGPTGKVMTLDANGKNPQVLYQAKEKNILVVALDTDGILYAGGDEQGLIYRIDPGSKQTRIAYDSQHGEISGLVFDEKGNLYAVTADASTSKPGAKLILSDGQKGRPAKGVEKEDKEKQKNERKKRTPTKPDKEESSETKDSKQDDKKSAQLVPPATSESSAGSSRSSVGSSKSPSGPAKPNDVYRISPQGYVQTLLNKSVVFLSLDYAANGELLIGTGHEGDLLSLDVDTQEAVVLYSAKPSLQVSSVLTDSAGTIYVGCANPGRVFAIEPYFAGQGYYKSQVIDADQISRWGKLQIEADIPADTRLTVSTRSGNTEDPKKKGWEEWTQAVVVTEDVVIRSSPGRFLQYRLRFVSEKGEHTAVVKSVKVACLTPNLPPRLESVEVKRTKPKSASSTAPKSTKAVSVWEVKWKGVDPNKDQLRYNVYIRPVGQKRWIRIAKELKVVQYKWESLTAADGRYEIKVEVTDELSNPKGEELTDSRVSRAIVVDNAPLEVSELAYQAEGKKVTVSAVLQDSLSAVGSVSYNLDSSEDWVVVMPDDGVYDSRRERVSFDIEIEDSGAHLLTIRFEDAMGNTTYRNLTVTIP